MRILIFFQIPRSRIVGNSMFNIVGNYQSLFQKGCTILHSHQHAWVFLFLHIFINACYFLIFVCLFEYHYSSSFILMISFVVFISSSLLPNDIEHSFMCLLTICVSSLENCSLTSFAHLLVGRLSSCLFVINSKYILDISPLSSYMIYKYFLLVCGFVFYLSCGVLWSANVFNNEVQFIKFLFYHLCFGAESLPNLASFVTLNF